MPFDLSIPTPTDEVERLRWLDSLADHIIETSLHVCELPREPMRDNVDVVHAFAQAFVSTDDDSELLALTDTYSSKGTLRGLPRVRYPGQPIYTRRTGKSVPSPGGEPTDWFPLVRHFAAQITMGRAGNSHIRGFPRNPVDSTRGSHAEMVDRPASH